MRQRIVATPSNAAMTQLLYPVKYNGVVTEKDSKIAFEMDAAIADFVKLGGAVAAGLGVEAIMRLRRSESVET